MGTTHRQTRSFKHEYELFVEQEIENYKESLPRMALMSLGDEAVAILLADPQTALTEILITEVVDRIILKRLRLPKYETWRRRQMKHIAELRRPEYHGFRSDDVLVRAVSPARDVLVAGAPDKASALYLAANGCAVTALDAEQEIVERVVQAAIDAGLGTLVHGYDLATWKPDRPLGAVIVNPAALNALTPSERLRVIEVLQSATVDGGVHLVQTIASSSKAADDLSIEELRTRYRGWEITLEPSESGPPRLLARKSPTWIAPS
jgi:hypothetical protein